ncbi:MAG: SpoIIE family protein phosphatase [Firmicutes bacterium]|nr:SpoIIE family protein phosphatase [Bacillota bacterium]
MMQVMGKIDLRSFTGHVSRLFSPANARRWQAFFAMALLARARMGPDAAPFAAAYFAAGLRNADTGPAMLAGCALGAFITGFDGAALAAPVACAAALMLHMLLNFIGGKLPALNMDAPSRAALNAGLSTLLPALAAAGYAPGMWLGALMCAIIAAVTAMVIMAEDVWWCACLKHIAAAAAVTLAAAGTGLDPAPVAALCAIIAGCAARGAFTGAALGVVCAFTGGGIPALSAVAVMGAAADIAPPGRFRQAGRSLLAGAAYGILALVMDMEFSPWMFGAAAAQAVIPQRFFEDIVRSCAPPARRDMRLMSALRRRDEDRLRALSDAFTSLSDACGASDPAFGEQQLITRMRAALCAGCSEYEKCWPGMGSGAVKLFCQLMTSAIECGGSPFPRGEVPPDIMRLCRRGMTVPNRLGAMLADFAAQRHRRIRLMEARRLIGAQFAQAAALLNTMAAENASPLALREGAAAHVKQGLISAGLPVKDVLAVRLENMEITAALNVPWTNERLARAAPVISAAMDRQFMPISVNGATAVFTPAGSFRAIAASSALPADPDSPCGDSCLIRKSAGKLFVALSDGMGNGEAAAEESCRVTGLMHSLVSAGLPRELAASTVNGVLLSRGGEELFATADMLMIDLDTGRAEFTKLAACRSYIVRGGRIQLIEGGQLPLGILDEVRPGIQQADLRRGDMVFMITDGVVDALSEPKMMEMMLEMAGGEPSKTARRLIDAAAGAADRRDDMTAVCVKIA